jgi:hypothetical protein
MSVIEEWNLRELVVIGIASAAGHDLHRDRIDQLGSPGWATCSKCGMSVWVAKRAQVADGWEDDGYGTWLIEGRMTRPLNFGTCSK